MRRIGIVGLGGQGRVHLNEIWDRAPFEVAWVFDANLRRPAGVSAGLVVQSLQQGISRGADLAVVATPPATHFRVAKSLLEAGINVLVEKPACTSFRETERLLEAAKRCERFVIVHFSRRWDPDFVAVRDVLQAYDFGCVHEIESRVTDAYTLSETYPGRKQWKLESPGGGILLDWGPHLFDQLFELMGNRKPLYLTCHSGRPNELVARGLEEQFTVHVEYSRGVTATLRASWNNALLSARWLVCGTRAALCVSRSGAAQGKVVWRDGAEVRVAMTTARERIQPHEGIRKLVESAMRRHRAPAGEERRIRWVAHAVDLAKLSGRTRRTCRWGL